MNTIKVILSCLFLIMPGFAYAYIGPGAGISAIGSLLALVAAVLLAIVGFVWYPVKRLMKGRRKAAAKASDGAQAGEEVLEKTRK